MATERVHRESQRAILTQIAFRWVERLAMKSSDRRMSFLDTLFLNLQSLLFSHEHPLAISLCPSQSMLWVQKKKIRRQLFGALSSNQKHSWLAFTDFINGINELKVAWKNQFVEYSELSCATQIWEGCFANGASENESQRASQNEVDRQAQFRGLRSRHGQSKISAWSNSASFRCFSFCNGIGRRAVGLGTDSLGIDFIITFFLFEKKE